MVDIHLRSPLLLPLLAPPKCVAAPRPLKIQGAWGYHKHGGLLELKSVFFEGPSWGIGIVIILLPADDEHLGRVWLWFIFVLI